MMIRENSATFLGEQIEGVFFNSLFDDEQRFGGLTYRQILNDDGLQLELSAGYGPSEPGGPSEMGIDLDSLDIATESLTVNASLTYAVIRSRKHNFYVYGGFQAIEEEVESLGEELTRDRLRVLYINGLYEFLDDFGGQSTLNLGLRQGLDAFGASEEGDSDLSRDQGVPDFTSVSLQVSRYQPIWEQLGVYLAAAGQYSFNTLLNSQEFFVGGESFGRGYNPSELSGDSGIGLSAEFQYTLIPPYDFWQSIQSYGFYDYGLVWNRDSVEQRRKSLASVGIGIRSRFFNRININLEVAWPLTRNPDTFDNDPRFFFQVLTRF